MSAVGAELGDFRVARYRLESVVERPIHLHNYAGSALRGAFGHALRRTVCVTGADDCRGCALYRSCAYPAIFEPPPPVAHPLQKFSQIPVPYVIEPPPWGERYYAPGQRFDFHLVLAGRAITRISAVHEAWRRALAHGIGTGSARLVDVRECGLESTDTAGTGDVSPAQVTLRLLTPLRLQQQGRPLGVAEISAARLLIGLVKRTALISEFHTGRTLDLDFHALAQAAGRINSSPDLRWCDWQRYSSRQQRKIALGGVVGTWRLGGDLAPFRPFLILGQWLHVGKNASFGLGQYRLEGPG